MGRRENARGRVLGVRRQGGGAAGDRRNNRRRRRFGAMKMAGDGPDRELDGGGFPWGGIELLS